MKIPQTGPRPAQFRVRLSRRIFVADGAMGTMLYSRGVFINRCFDELNLTAPAMIAEIHREYIAVGAEILGTNTFGANRTRLMGFGLADKTVAINQAGVRLAREAASEEAYVAGSIGPLGVHLEPLGTMTLVRQETSFSSKLKPSVNQALTCWFWRHLQILPSCGRRSLRLAK
jgi:methionine synthase I (cobalamin-dependent)